MQKFFLPALLALSVAHGAFAQSGPAMTEAELIAVTGNGVTLKLGGEGMGYTGELVLTADGKGEGGATMDNGDKLPIAGTWSIKGDRFCRVWKGIDDEKEVCEIWYKTSDTSVEVYNGDQMLGVNSW